MDALIHHLEEGLELSLREVEVAAELLLDSHVADEKKARLLEALSRKGETAAEITGFVEAFLQHAVDPHVGLLDLEGPTIDVCGTGGDKLDLFNVSTTAMFVVAAAGGIVVKHGNRGITSKSGGADVLEALGIRIDLSAEGFRDCLEKAGVGFLFAPMYHPAFKAVIGVRKLLAEKGVRTIFNLIGPLMNPARPQCQLTGVFVREMCPVFAEILQRLGRDAALNKLPEHYRSVVLLADVHEFDYKEVAEVLDIPIGTVMSRLSRARTQLKKSLAKVAVGYGIKKAQASQVYA